MSAPGQPKRDAAGAACRNAAAELEELAERLRDKCLHAFSEPAEIPVEMAMVLYEIGCAIQNLHAAADEYYEEPDEETIQAMRRIREQAVRDAAERERRKNDG